MSATITPTLFMGDPSEAVWLDNLYFAVTVDEAVRYILNGDSALLPEGAWKDAEEVLRRLGCTEDWIKNRIEYARTGTLPG